MTDDEPQDVSTPASFAVVEEFLDGEPVDGAELKNALATDDGRAYLVDLLALRHCMAASYGGTGRDPRSAALRVTLRRWSPAAAAVLLASLLGYAVGAGTGRSIEGERQPAVEAAIELPQPRAPEPTQVIQLRPAEGSTF